VNVLVDTSVWSLALAAMHRLTSKKLKSSPGAFNAKTSYSRQD